TPSRKKELTSLQNELNIQFFDVQILNTAFTHKSFINENQDYNYFNERLELLGDSILSLITVEYLYNLYPYYDEGKLSKMKSILVSEKILSEIARTQNFSKYLLLGKGEKSTGGSNRDSNLANLVEAFLGAIYLDQGLEAARNWFSKFLVKYAEDLKDKKVNGDSKTNLQEFVQKKFKIIPIYKLLKETGPDHQKKFLVEVSAREFSAVGEGNSKRKAEADAAIKLLQILKSNKR
ncbi:MAG: ribonuclease III, partial [Leptospiraceae bacterium]|nr:ribonuclease III [Leptospiraceae bacterium]